MHKLMHIVDENMTQALPDMFAVVSDGWAGEDTHYVGVFATYPGHTSTGFRKHLLCFSPMGEEYSKDATQHYDYVEYVLEVLGKTFETVGVIIGDNTATKKAFACRVGSIFLVCYSHSYNLAMKDVLFGYKIVIDKIHNLMRNLRYQIPAAKLRRVAHLTAQIDTETRWSSTFALVKRLLEMKEHVATLDLPELTELLLNEEEALVNTSLKHKLRDLEYVTKHLQCDYVKVLEERVCSMLSWKCTRRPSPVSVEMPPLLQSPI